jgi:SAM-dependent methyltransferase
MVKIKATGTKADISGKVEIGKVYGGYFSDPKTAQAFCNIGIKPILSKLPKAIKYSDFGGGDGYLGKFVNDYLKKNSKRVNTIIVDANPKFLKETKKRGLKTKLANLQDVKIMNFDLITMRAVLHYQAHKEQLKIMKTAYKNLKKGGYLIHQLSTGEKRECDLRTAIVNLSSLRNLSEGDYLWITKEEYIKLCTKAGFSEIRFVGDAPSHSWGPEEQWERFNSAKRADALAKGNLKEVEAIDKRKDKYFADTKNLLKVSKYKNAIIKKTKTGSYVVPYEYAIILARK